MIPCADTINAANIVKTLAVTSKRSFGIYCVQVDGSEEMHVWTVTKDGVVGQGDSPKAAYEDMRQQK